VRNTGLAIFIFLLFCGIADSAVTISGHTGTAAPGYRLTFSGSGFGTGPAHVEWLGAGCTGSGCIDTGTVNSIFTRSGWSNGETTESAHQSPVYSTSTPRRPGKQVLSTVFSAYWQYQGTYSFDPGSVQTNWRYSYWVYTDLGSWGGQHKDTRIQTQDSVDDTYLQEMHSTWYEVDGSINQAYAGCTWYMDGITPIYSPGCGYQFGNNDGPANIALNTWAFIEVEWKAPTGTLTEDGVLSITRTPIGGVPRTHTSTSVGALPNGRWFEVEDYLGNSNQMAPAYTRLSPVGIKILRDDIHISWGDTAKAHVLLCDNANYAQRTHCEEQHVYSWDSTVVIDVNIGSFSPTATVYAFIFDSNGLYNGTGHEIGLSGSVTQYALTVTNTGHGTVTSSPAGINCGVVCSANFDSGTAVTLTATPDSGYGVAWSGDCDSTGHVTMSAAKSCTATFSPLPVQYLPWVAPQQ